MTMNDRYIQWKYDGGHIVLTATALGFFILPAGWYASGKEFPFSPLFFCLLGGAGGFAFGKAIAMVVVQGSGRAAQAIYMPATAGMRESDHSEIDTLEVRGDFKGAVAAWEAVAVSEPENSWALVRAGELYARELGDPAMAMERFRHARSLPTAKPELVRYMSQKIIDLLIGPLDDKGRAMVELRKLIDQFPTSREAEGAREALRKLKAEHIL